jgi:hypothetical protein
MLRGLSFSRRFVVFILACSMTLAAASGLAQTAPAAPPPPVTPPAPAPWYDQISVNGMVSVSYTGNLNSPPSRQNQFRVFDTDAATFQLDVAQLAVQRAVSKPGDVGFRIDLIAGALANVTAASGLFRDESGEAGDFDVLQAYLSYIAPAGRGLRFDAGKFTTPIGYEVTEGYEDFNDHHSHSFLFGYAEPVSHTGVRVSYPFSDQVSAQVLLVNGWDNATDNNAGKSIGGQLAVAPSDRLSVVAVYMGGPEQTGNTDNFRHTFDTYADVKASPALSFGLNYGYGCEGQVALAETAGGGVVDATWQGIAGYARYAFSGRFALALRGDWFDDPQGARTGYVQSLKEATLTPEFRPHRNLVVRGDLRLDKSNRRVFELSDGTLGSSQATISVNALVVF